MPLYRWNTDNLEAVTPTTFEAEQLEERAHLQRHLRDQPDVLEEGLFVVAEEFSSWQDSYRSIDLLALDRTGRLVIIELKRTQSGDHSELQAVRYAAMVSNMTLEQIIDAHRNYLAKRGRDEDARIQVLHHLGVADEADAEIRTERPRIILASAGFSRELTTSVLWLNDNGLDIACIRLRLYRNGDEKLMDTDQVIPLPEASDYLVKVRERRAVERRQWSRSQAETFPGGDVFRGAIEAFPAKDLLEILRQWAVSLENENLASLSTSVSPAYTTLNPRLPDSSRALVYIRISRAGQGYLEWERSAFDRYAPGVVERIEKIISPHTIGRGNNMREIPDGLLDALTDAYREANGQPTTPPPDTAPGSPALAE